MKETVEHNNRFYTNEKGEIKTENEQLKEWLIIANKENERLKEENTILKQTMSNNSLLINENALLKSIIKEVREYVEELTNDEESIELMDINSLVQEHILEILDKADKVNNKTKEVMPVEELEGYEPKNMAELEYQDWFWD